MGAALTVQPPNILLVDGDTASRQQFREFFDRLGWRYTVADTRSESLTAVNEQRFDVVITDLAMPNLDGASFFSELLKNHPGQAIIAVSKDASLDQALKVFRSGAADLLARPIDFSWLERSVRQLVQGIRDDARERHLYRYRIRQDVEFELTSRELAQHGVISLPIISQLKDCGAIDEQSALRFRLGFQEVIVNALEHGNLELKSEWKEEFCSGGIDKFSILRRERLASDEYGNRTVRIRVVYEPDSLKITVRDCGEGFLNKLGTPTDSGDENVQCHGRGLALIASSADELRFDANGAEVTLIKYLPTDGHGTQV